MSDLTRLTLAEARDGLRSKTFTATELAEAHIAAIEQANPVLNAYVLPTPDHALAQAKASDARLAKGDARPLEGLPRPAAGTSVTPIFPGPGVASCRPS